MIQFDLSSEEKELLRETLECCLSDTRMEIADTDQMDFREEIKKRKELLLKIIEQLEKQDA